MKTIIKGYSLLVFAFVVITAILLSFQSVWMVTASYSILALLALILWRAGLIGVVKKIEKRNSIV